VAAVHQETAAGRLVREVLAAVALALLPQTRADATLALELLLKAVLAELELLI
jgi:hypothetical protein